ncbi:YfjI family protein [Ectopseudomonas composti]|uniref:YfjI family protein n=1 Tax=Ectopseudomonas composti TaxID=658457 RepID=UPI0009EAFD03|nr:YfjI family protein [Pseudomonas composti]
MTNSDEFTPLEIDSLGEDWPRFHEHSLLEAAVTEASRELQISREMALMSAFGAMATACQGHVDVELPTGHRRPTSLMLLTIAESGERKTTAQNYFFDEIYKSNNSAYHDNQIAQNRYKQENHLWNIKKRSLEKQYSKHLTQEKNTDANTLQQTLTELLSAQPSPPRSRKFLYDDTTPQALVQMLYENISNGCLLTSEANSIFSGKALEELDKLNTLWDGGTVIVDRISRESFLLQNARLTLALMVQPSVISRFMDKRGDEARGTGFLSRFLVVKARTMAGQRTNKLLSEQPKKQEFNERILHMLNTQMGTDRQILRFSEHAKNAWFEYSSRLESEMQENGLYFYLKDHASKLLENVSRLAAILHSFESNSEHDTQIESSTLEFCWKFSRQCSSHFMEHLADEPQLVTDTNLLVNYLLKKAYSEQHHNNQSSASLLPENQRPGVQTSFIPTDIKQYGPGCLRGNVGSDRLMASIQLLTKLGHILKSGGRYDFSESIFTRARQEMRNGEFIKINSLPLHSEQIRENHSRGYPSVNYLIISKDIMR